MTKLAAKVVCGMIERGKSLEFARSHAPVICGGILLADIPELDQQKYIDVSLNLFCMKDE